MDSGALTLFRRSCRVAVLRLVRLSNPAQLARWSVLANRRERRPHHQATSGTNSP